MRQLVSIITDTSLSYFVHETDDDTTTQIAQLITPEPLDVPAVITLGVNLIDALKLNGKRTTRAAIAPPVVESTPERRENGAHAKLAASDLKAAETALCPVCGLGYRRSSLTTHLQRLHGWNATKARLTARSAPLAPDDVPRSTRGGSRGRTVEGVTTRQRLHTQLPPGVLWPKLTSDEIVEYVRDHPGVTSREIAAMLADTTHRAVKTTSNRCDAIAQRGRLRFDVEQYGNTKRRRYYAVESVS